MRLEMQVDVARSRYELVVGAARVREEICGDRFLGSWSERERERAVR